MPPMPEILAKGPILTKLDRLLSNPATRMLAYADMATTPPLLTAIAQTYSAGLSVAEENHINNQWFGTWWPTAQPVEPIVRKGIMVALEEANKRMLPVDCYWACHIMHYHAQEHGPEGKELEPMPGDHVEVSVSWSLSQVTLTLHTPAPPPRLMPELTIPEPIKIIRRDPPFDSTGPIIVVDPVLTHS